MTGISTSSSSVRKTRKVLETRKSVDEREDVVVTER